MTYPPLNPFYYGDSLLVDLPHTDFQVRADSARSLSQIFSAFTSPMFREAPQWSARKIASLPNTPSPSGVQGLLHKAKVLARALCRAMEVPSSHPHLEQALLIRDAMSAHPSYWNTIVVSVHATMDPAARNDAILSSLMRNVDVPTPTPAPELPPSWKFSASFMSVYVNAARMYAPCLWQCTVDELANYIKTGRCPADKPHLNAEVHSLVAALDELEIDGLCPWCTDTAVIPFLVHLSVPGIVDITNVREIENDDDDDDDDDTPNLRQIVSVALQGVAIGSDYCVLRSILEHSSERRAQIPMEMPQQFVVPNTTVYLAPAVVDVFIKMLEHDAAFVQSAILDNTDSLPHADMMARLANRIAVCENVDTNLCISSRAMSVYMKMLQSGVLAIPPFNRPVVHCPRHPKSATPTVFVHTPQHDWVQLDSTEVSLDTQVPTEKFNRLFQLLNAPRQPYLPPRLYPTQAVAAAIRDMIPEERHEVLSMTPEQARSHRPLFTFLDHKDVAGVTWSLWYNPTIVRLAKPSLEICGAGDIGVLLPPVPTSPDRDRHSEDDARWAIAHADTPDHIYYYHTTHVVLTPSAQETPVPAPAPVPVQAPAGLDPITAMIWGNIQPLISQAALVSPETVKALVDEALKQVTAPTITVTAPPAPPKDLPRQHFMFELVLRIITAKVPLYLWGGAGSSKTSLLMACAQALDIPANVLSFSRDTTRSQIMGYVTAQGTEAPSLLYDAVHNGKFAILDEFDAGGVGSLVLNAVLANGVCEFYGRMVEQHANFQIAVTANTPGTGAANGYRREPVDAATRDRMFVLELPRDEGLEAHLCGVTKKSPTLVIDEGGILSAKAWLDLVNKYRKAFTTLNMPTTLTSSMRPAKLGAILAANGIGRHWLEEGLIRRGLAEDSWNKVKAAAGV